MFADSNAMSDILPLYKDDMELFCIIHGNN